MMRLGWPLIFLWYGQICVPAAVAILEEYCMAFANMQQLFLSGERIVAHGHLVTLPHCAIGRLCSETVALSWASLLFWISVNRIYTCITFDRSKAHLKLMNDMRTTLLSRSIFNFIRAKRFSIHFKIPNIFISPMVNKNGCKLCEIPQDMQIGDRFSTRSTDSFFF